MHALFFNALPASDREEGPQTKRRKGPAEKGFGQPDYGSIAGVVAIINKDFGTGPGQFKNDASMRQVSFGSNSTVWASDFHGSRVHHFKQNGELIKTIGTGTAGDGPRKLNKPIGVAVSRLSSSIFISEHNNSRISEFNQSDGAVVRVLDTPGVRQPYGMCLSPDETTLAAACGSNNCIKLYRVDGSEAPRTIGENGVGDGQFNSPSDVHFTPDGQQVVVADQGNNRVQVLSLDGSFVRKIELGDYANAVAVDAAGNLIATTANAVKVFSPEGTLLHDRLGGLEFSEITACALAIEPSSGRIAVGDGWVGRVHLL
jgi:sugar lactone lactonase YvrE